MINWAIIHKSEVSNRREGRQSKMSWIGLAPGSETESVDWIFLGNGNRNESETFSWKRTRI